MRFLRTNALPAVKAGWLSASKAAMSSALIMPALYHILRNLKGLCPYLDVRFGFQCAEFPAIRDKTRGTIRQNGNNRP